ncbi:TPA: hypothetical protein ACNEJR_003719 [Escherichia coli]|nr:hypothetical protein [Salmonella enterica subsp. enterica serovar Enteritidis]
MKGTYFETLADRAHEQWLDRFYRWRGLPYPCNGGMEKIIKINKRHCRGLYPRGKVFGRMLELHGRKFY